MAQIHSRMRREQLLDLAPAGRDWLWPIVDSDKIRNYAAKSTLNKLRDESWAVDFRGS
jgi:hypothetical protein